MSRARSQISRRTPCNPSPSVLAIIQHIILFHPGHLWTAIEILTIITYIALFFTRKPDDTIVEEDPSVLADIQHIILFHPSFLYKAIRLLSFILFIIPFFLNLLYQAIASAANFLSPTPFTGPNKTSPTPTNTPQPQRTALTSTTKTYHLRSHAAGSLGKSQDTPSVQGMCLRGGKTLPA